MVEMMITTNRLVKQFGNQQAVKDVSIHVPKQSVYALLGPNGAGKSTLLKMLTGMMAPTSGEIVFDGTPWQRAHLADVGAMIEGPPIYENLTAKENMMVRSLLLGIPKERIDEMLKLVDLTNTGKKVAGKFSLGMKQRLGIAMALLAKPKLLILDEPTNGLDPIGIKDLRRFIRTLPELGITVIVSSHVLSEVELVADYIGIIRQRELRYEGQLSEVENLERLFLTLVQEQGGAGK